MQSPAHESASRQPSDHGSGTDGQFAEADTDGFVDQRGASHAGEQDEQQGKVARGVRRAPLGVLGTYGW